MKNLRHLIVASAVAHTLLVASPASAETAEDKFLRGLAGMTCGVMELPGNIVQETRAQGAVGIPVGAAKGLGMIVARELVGVYEFLSAPFPAPAGFRPILHPEYPWDYFR